MPKPMVRRSIHAARSSDGKRAYWFHDPDPQGNVVEYHDALRYARESVAEAIDEAAIICLKRGYPATAKAIRALAAKLDGKCETCFGGGYAPGRAGVGTGCECPDCGGTGRKKETNP